MTATEEKGGGGITELIGGILKNPAMLEGILAAVSAISASKRVKTPDSGVGGFDLGNIIGMIPQFLPLVNLFFTPGVGFLEQSEREKSASQLREIFGEIDNPDGDAVAVMALDGDENGSGAESSVPVMSDMRDISYGSAKERRENLILAIRPFLSESRVAAADAMLEINKISGIFGA